MCANDCTDYANDHPATETLPTCDNCGRRFDYNYEGHEDEETGLSFCDATCEMHYDWDIGLPNKYVRA